jgi:serine/threonine protein kinase
MTDPASDEEARAIGDQPTALSDAPGASPDGGLAAGSMVSEYRVERELGRGGMGIVYAGRQPVIDKRVAIKVLSAAASRDPGLGRRFVEEARAVNRIGHPNIIDIFAFGQLEDGRQYFVMEYLYGETLADLLEREPPSERELCTLLAQAAEALEAAHGERIVHRDLKPENLWVARPRHGEPFLKVLDFGIAKLLSDASEGGLTATGAVLGTPYYMAPEQCMGAEVDARADIYALGVILYRALTNKLPFTGRSFAEIVSQHVVRTPASPTEAGARVSPQLEALTMACLEKDPAKRPQRAADVAAVLREVAAAGAPKSVAPKPARRSLNPLTVTAIAILVALAIAGLFLHFTTQPEDVPEAAGATTPVTLEPSAEPAPEPAKAAAEPAPEPSAEPVAEPAPAAPAQRAPEKPTAKPSRAKSDGLIEDNPF